MSASVGPDGTSVFSESKRVCCESDDLPSACEGGSTLLPAAANELASESGLPLRSA